MLSTANRTVAFLSSQFSTPALLGLSSCSSDFLAAGLKFKEETAKQVAFDLKSICEWDGTSCVADMMTETMVEK